LAILPEAATAAGFKSFWQQWKHPAAAGRNLLDQCKGVAHDLDRFSSIHSKKD